MKKKPTKPVKRIKPFAVKSSALEKMRERVSELEETLRAIRSGEVDAVAR